MKINLLLVLAAITALAFGTPLESLSPNSPAALLLKDYCSKFTNISINDLFPVFEFINMLPNIEFTSAVDTLNRNEEGNHYTGKSAFGILQVFFAELEPKENTPLQLTDLKSENCSICYGSKATYFYEMCGFAVCKKCFRKVGLHCPGCRLWHRHIYVVTLFQLDKSYYPFVAVPALPEKPNINESIKYVYSSLNAWVGKLSKPSYLQSVNPIALRRKIIEEQTKSTIKILQILDSLHHHSLLEFKAPLVALETSLSIIRKILSNIDPKRLFISIMDTVEFEDIKQKFAEMKSSFWDIIYYVQWLMNIFIRQCYHSSNDGTIIADQRQYSTILNFVREFGL